MKGKGKVGRRVGEEGKMKGGGGREDEGKGRVKVKVR